MEDKNKNPIENSDAFTAGSNPASTPPPPQPPISPNPMASQPPVSPPPAASIPTSPQPGSSGGKGSTIIVGGILLLFIIIVVALYFLILRQSYEPEVPITPPPIQQTQPDTKASPTPVNPEEGEVINIDLEENLDEEFAPIDEDINQL